MAKGKNEMNIKLSPRIFSSNLPICRNRLYEEVVSDSKYGLVNGVWLSPGHVFITLKQGTQLFTFDTKPTGKAHEENKGCLDLSDLFSPIIDVLVSSINYSIVFLVQKNGSIQCWRYRSDYTWYLVQRFDIRVGKKREITSVCLHSVHNTIYWCERQKGVEDNVGSYCICRQQVPEDEEKLKGNDFSPAQIIINNCPEGLVYPLSFGVAIVFRVKQPLVSMTLLWLPVTNKIHVHVGSQQMELLDFSTRHEIDFRKLAFKLVCLIAKTPSTEQMMAVAHNTQLNCLSVVDVSGSVRKISDREAVDKDSGNIMVTLPNTMSEMKWFDHQGILGAVSSSSISLYDSRSGDVLDVLQSPDNSEIFGPCKLCAGCMWSAFYTKQNIYIIQKTKVPHTEVSVEEMVKQRYQTQAVELAFLEQLKLLNSSVPVYKRISELGKLWETEIGMKSPSTKLAQTVHPYLKEYWKLEKTQQAVISGHLEVNSICPGDVEGEVLRVLSPQTNISMTVRQGCLLLLANKYPSNILEVLMSQLEFDTEDISSAQLQRWQCILAQDTVESPVSTDVAVPMFEHICHLLFKIQPSRLVNFVKIAQLINDQRVGVSAFIRKRQALQFYDRALACLPEISEAENKEESLAAYIQLLLASEHDGCEFKALQLCLREQCWDQAISLVAQKSDNSDTHIKLFLEVLLCMRENGILHQYADEILKHMPICKSFSSLSAVLQGKGDDKTMLATNVFTNSSQSLLIAQIRPYLLKNLKVKNKDS